VNTRSVCAGFGRYLGTRFKEKKNLIWLAGGDFTPPAGSEGEARHREILDGIRAAGASQPWTGHWNVEHLGGISTDQARFLDAMTLNGVYQYASTYRYAGRAYDVQPARPVYLLESTYEHEDPGTDAQPFRKAWWWTMLSGGTGVLWSNNFLWMCETARGVHRPSMAIPIAPSRPGRTSSSPEGRSRRCTCTRSSRGCRGTTGPRRPVLRPWPAGQLLAVVGERRIVAASTHEGDLLVAYVPPTGSGSRSFNLDLSACAARPRPLVRPERWRVVARRRDPSPRGPRRGGDARHERR